MPDAASAPTRLAVWGATGRMGRRVVALAAADPAYQIVAAVASPQSPHQGADIGPLCGCAHLGVPVTAELPLAVTPECVIDFSSHHGLALLLETCIARRRPLVVATTGHSAADLTALDAAALHTAVLHSPSMSLVVNLLFKLTQLTARAVAGRGFDVEIIERHHRFKKDAPSGTAARFARIVQQEMRQTAIRHGREGLLGERPAAEIGIHAVRAGDSVGEHTVIFSALGETMELVHKGYSRDSYAHGALLAAQYLAAKPAGRYTMADVLGLDVPSPAQK